MRVVILGRTKILYDTMQLLHHGGHEVVLVGTCKAPIEYTIKEESFINWAQQHKIPSFCNTNLNDQRVLSLLDSCNADIAISVNWINIIAQNVISKFPYGILNAHAGDLPRFRGNACPNWAILLGEKRVGVSVHFMQPGELDSGDILLKQFFKISKETTIGSIYNWLYEIVPQMFVKAIEGLEKGFLVAKKQSNDFSDILRVYPRKPEDSIIQWNQSGENIIRLINASSRPFLGAYTYYHMKKLIIWKACFKNWDVPSVAIPGQVVFRNKATGYVGIACLDGVIVLCDIQLENDMIRKASVQIIESMRDRLGINIEDTVCYLYKEIIKLHSKKRE